MLDINELIKIVKKDGEFLKSAVLKSSDVHEKSGHVNFVTKYDLASQNYLQEEFAKRWPEYNFIGEEEPIAKQLTDKPAFIVDPIDGTSNFMYGVPNSAISVAVVENQETVQGVVYNFFTDELFTAEKGKGAYLNGERIYAPERPLDGSLCAVGTSPYNEELRTGTLNMIEAILEHCDVRRMGAAALDFCYVACGRFSAFVELTMQAWDYGAGYLICEEAGAVVTDIKGNKIRPLGESSIVAGNPIAHKELFEKVNISSFK